jgi:UDP-2,4-diacetamido-2,4,6-trideoxy-beta-L-altropyranose hydrolase
MTGKGTRIFFRVDASILSGSGHVMRCLTLADGLRDAGADVSFISRRHEGNLNDLIHSKDFQVFELPVGVKIQESCYRRGEYAQWLGASQHYDAREVIDVLRGLRPEWLILDHYAIDEEWEQLVRPYVNRIMVIDDLADRSHYCDLFLDQNLGRTLQDYDGLLMSSTKVLIGPQYALLRPEFAQWREYSLRRRAKPQLKHLLITMGGVDQSNVTCDVLSALQTCELPDDLHITVVMGVHAPWLAEVKAQVGEMHWRTEIQVGVNNIAQIMANSDLTIGGSGSTSWERCCLGVPSIQCVIADNQKCIADALVNVGAAVLVEPNKLRQELPYLIKQFRETRIMQDMVLSSSAITDGKGLSRLIHLQSGGLI